MRARISTLAQLMKLKRANGSSFVLMLGAGASLSSEIKATATIMQELLDRFGQDIPEGELTDRFDELWRRSPPDQREMFLTPYLDRKPSSGYLNLARLIQAGYFDLVITFNYDDLLRKALEQIGFNDFHQVIRGDTDEAKLVRLVEEKPPKRHTIFKLHGSLYSTSTFLFDRGEMLNYPKDLEALFGRLTSRDIIVCGYAFADNCVTRAFSPDGGSVFWVNPSGAPSNAKGFLLNRRSKDFVVSGELGMFDRFFRELSAEVLDDHGSGGGGPRANPFKFLQSFDVTDGAWFFGREALTRQVLDRMAQRPGSLHLIGPSKVGKTSLVRAGILAGLPASESYEYQRCRVDLAEELREVLAKRLQRKVEESEMEPALAELVQSVSGHLVIVFDQFERVVKACAGSDEDGERLAKLLRRLGAVPADRITFLFAAVNENEYYKLMWTAGLNPPHIEVKSLTAEEAISVVERQASQASLRFEADILVALRGKCEEKGPAGVSTFTLAHLQAICYLLALRAGADRQSYASLIGSELESSLDSAIRECDIMNFVEDLPAKQERKLLRVIMRIVSEPSRRIIAAHIRDRFADLLKDEQYPEPF